MLTRRTLFVSLTGTATAAAVKLTAASPRKAYFYRHPDGTYVTCVGIKPSPAPFRRNITEYAAAPWWADGVMVDSVFYTVRFKNGWLVTLLALPTSL
jgi:hypothetical protein